MAEDMLKISKTFGPVLDTTRSYALCGTLSAAIQMVTILSAASYLAHLRA